jgi:hypothetical protein
MATSNDTPPHDPLFAALRIIAALSVAMSFGLGIYALLESARPAAGLIGFSFLLVLPAAISAFVAYIADPSGDRRLGTYLLVPLWLILAVIVLSATVLREGVICILILSPLWLLSGLAGAGATYLIRKRLRRGRTYCTVLLLIPLAAIQFEPLLPLPSTIETVTRTIVVEAPPERIWPLLRGIPDVRPGEGSWNISQDLIGVPRPIGARLIGDGEGAERIATWGHNISFRERITDWQEGSRLAWRFIFDDIDGWGFTDRHLMPDSPYFRVTSGGYRMMPLGPNRTRVVLDTDYWIRTPVNAYSALWGELFLGDLENNLLALIKRRAERPVVP